MTGENHVAYTNDQTDASSETTDLNSEVSSKWEFFQATIVRTILLDRFREKTKIKCFPPN